MKSVLFLLLNILNSVSGSDLEVKNWVIPPDTEPYPSLDANVGDKIIFTWPEGTIADVHIHPTGDCEEDGAILVGYQSNASYIFRIEDAGKQFLFACDVGRRCEAGQNIIVLVSDDLPEAQISAVETIKNESAATGRNGGLLSTLALVTAGIGATMFL